ANRRTVEQLPDREEFLVDGRSRDVEVLLHAREIRESDVEELDVLFLDEREHLGGIFEHGVSRVGAGGARSGQAASNLSRGHCPSVSRMFRGCYGGLDRLKGWSSPVNSPANGSGTPPPVAAASAGSAAASARISSTRRAPL